MVAMQGFDLETYLSDAYQGEVFGEAFFALLAERTDDADEAAKWRLLEHLERHVKGRLRQELERRGLPRDESPASVEEGRKAACGVGAFPSGVDARAFRDTQVTVVDRVKRPSKNTHDVGGTAAHGPVPSSRFRSSRREPTPWTSRSTPSPLTAEITWHARPLPAA